MKKIAALSLFLVSGACLFAQTLSWDLKFSKGSTQETVPVSRIIPMETGEVFKITIKPDADCFGYVVAYDSGRNASILHDAPMKKNIELILGPAKLTEPKGTEIIYVIMSLKKQAKLEKLIKAYNANPNSRQNADNLQREIMGLQNTVSGLGEPASSFIPSGGTARGSGEEYTNRFSDKNIYVRTITIRH